MIARISFPVQVASDNSRIVRSELAKRITSGSPSLGHRYRGIFRNARCTLRIGAEQRSPEITLVI